MTDRYFEKKKNQNNFKEKVDFIEFIEYYKYGNKIKGAIKMKLLTSNKNKLKEFKRFGIPNIEMALGKDIKEVDSDPITVAVYKSLDSGEDTVIEDTSLHVEGADIGVNVRWLFENLGNYNGNKAVWEVLLAHNDGVEINIYQGKVKGRITNAFEDLEGFGFDKYFIPESVEKTLCELESDGKKDLFSARRIAVDNLINKKPIKTVKIADVEKWKGAYQ